MIEIKESGWKERRTIVFPWDTSGIDSELHWTWEIEEQLYAQMMGWA